MKPRILIPALLLPLAVGVLWFALRGEAEEPLPPSEVLAEQAMAVADDAEAQRTAARQLLRHQQATTNQFRQLADSDDNVVRSFAYQGLGENGDFASVPRLIDALYHDSPQVRGQAGAALKKILKVDYGYRANDPAEKRNIVAQEIRIRYEAVKNVYVPE